MGLMRHKLWDSTWRSIWTWLSEWFVSQEELTLVFFCNSGRHRSVGFVELLARCCTEMGIQANFHPCPTPHPTLSLLPRPPAQPTGDTTRTIRTHTHPPTRQPTNPPAHPPRAAGDYSPHDVGLLGGWHMWWGPGVPAVPVASPVVADRWRAVSRCQAWASMSRGPVLLAVPPPFWWLCPKRMGDSPMPILSSGVTRGVASGVPHSLSSFFHFIRVVCFH